MKGELCIKTGYSFLSSTLKVEDIIDIAKNNKYEYLGIMDKDVMFGTMEFYNACVKNNIKPLDAVGFLEHYGLTEIFEQDIGKEENIIEFLECIVFVSFYFLQCVF